MGAESAEPLLDSQTGSASQPQPPPTQDGSRIHEPLPAGTESSERARALSRLAPLFIAALLALAFYLLHRELAQYRYRDVQQSLAAIPWAHLLWALLLTVASYVSLTGYDTLALRYLGIDLPYARRALASFLGYVFSYNIGLSVLGGAAPRYRLYSAWGLTAVDIAKLVGFAGLTFWLGALALAAAALFAQPTAMMASLRLPEVAAYPAAFVLVGLVVLYIVACAVRRAPLSVRGWDITLPSPVIAVQQLVLSTVDWALAAAVLFVLLPRAAEIGYFHFVGLFVIAQVGGVVSHVPAGLGVFETILILALGPYIPAPTILGSIVAFRVVYYLLPLAVATASLAAHEVITRWEHLDRLRTAFGRFIPEVAPRLLSVTVFVGGTLLLVSGATPSAPGRLDWMQDFLPVPVVQISHFLGSLAGLGLLLLASGLQRRLDAAYHLTVMLLVAGMGFSLLKGLDYEEALILAAMLAMLVPCKAYFYRRTSIIAERFSMPWIISIAVVIGGSTWLGFFAHRHVEYATDLWWEFSLFSDAPRFLRATVGVVGATLFFAAAHLLRPARPRVAPPEPETMGIVRGIVAASPYAPSSLALLGDKLFLLNPEQNAFIMYAVAGRSWVAMGDPVGPPEAYADLVWRFRELCDRHGAWPVFYEASPARLPFYLDVGLQPLKFGEEARVLLDAFSLEGRPRKEMRYVLKHLERQGCTFEVVPKEGVEALIPELRVVSDTWLREKRTREKAFSLGCFDPAYLSQFPIAVVRYQDAITAFTNLWCGAERHEVSPDLMRYRADGPKLIMDYLFLQSMLWAKGEGYRWFNLGMAPLAGLESRHLAPLWHRLGAFAFQHGEQLYNFQGLRQYKDKFGPIWEPRYLVSPGGFVLPRLLANVAALVSGGLKGVVSK